MTTNHGSAPPPAGIDWTHELTEQVDWHWRAQLRPRLEGLTDAEYRWEPAPGAWTAVSYTHLDVYKRQADALDVGSCPSDRAHAAAAHLDADVAGADREPVIARGLLGPVPVSYTHLDVYKRQQ